MLVQNRVRVLLDSLRNTSKSLKGVKILGKVDGIDGLVRDTLDQNVYYRTHPDVAAANFPAYSHYVRYGIQDGRALLDEESSIDVDEATWIRGFGT